jgi:Fe-S-cluster containining protein
MNNPETQTTAEPMIVNGITIDPRIFTQGFVERCDISKCGGECCNSGVWADIVERDVILKHSAMIQKYMDETQEKDVSKWFDKETVPDTDFDSGIAVGTQVVNDRCVFQMQNGFCVIQSAAMQEGMEPWAIKPKYCVMFPIVVVDKVLGYDDDHANDMHYCGLQCHVNHTHTVFEACEGEIEYALGKEGFAVVKAHYEANKEEYRKQMEGFRDRREIQPS